MLKMLKYSATSLRRHGSPDPCQPLPFAFPPSPHPSSTTRSAAAPLELRRTAAGLRRTCHFTLLTLSTQDLSARSNRFSVELAAIASSTATIWHHLCRSASPTHICVATQALYPRRTQASNEYHLQNDISRPLLGRFHSSKASSGIFQTHCGH